METLKIVETLWFTQMGVSGVIGIIQTKGQLTGERKAYIGSAPGNDAESDAMHIVETGSKFNLGQVNNVFSTLVP